MLLADVCKLVVLNGLGGLPLRADSLMVEILALAPVSFVTISSVSSLVRYFFSRLVLFPSLSKSDDEIYELAKPIWDNLVRSSNLKDYGGFTRDFSTQMLFGANEVELGKQWANNKLIVNLQETFEPFGCLRRGVHVTVLIKQTNKELPGEFLGRLVLGVEDNLIKVFGATIY